MNYNTCDRCDTSVESIKARLDLDNYCPTCNGTLYPTRETSIMIETDRTKKHCRRCEAFFPNTQQSCPICNGILLNN